MEYTVIDATVYRVVGPDRGIPVATFYGADAQELARAYAAGSNAERRRRERVEELARAVVDAADVRGWRNSAIDALREALG
jgi:hypothetical protein